MTDLATSHQDADSAGAIGRKYYGKYRGQVTINVDPMQIGRIQAQVPDVSLPPTTWCTPCVPAAGLQTGMLAVPPIGAGVWIEFEQGDPDYPIWTGCFWGQAAELPALMRETPPGLSSLTFQTTLQNAIAVNDVPGPTGGIILKASSGASVIVNDTGIYLSNGQGAAITLIGPSVDINSGGLTVT